MKYAVIALGGKQYKVSEGDLLTVDSQRIGKKPNFNPEAVLLFADEKSVDVGTPHLKNVKVSIELEKEQRGKKIEVRRFRAKSRYRRYKGHRQNESVLRIKTIEKSK